RAAANCCAPRQTPSTGKPAPTAVRNRIRSSSSQPSSSWTPIGPPMTTSPVTADTAAGAGIASPRSTRTICSRPPASRTAVAIDPGPSWGTCWITTQGSPAPTTRSGDADDAKQLGRGPLREPGHLALEAGAGEDPLGHAFGIGDLALVAEQCGHLALHRRRRVHGNARRRSRRADRTHDPELGDGPRLEALVVEQLRMGEGIAGVRVDRAHRSLA